MDKSINNILRYKHAYHLVDASPWPIFSSFSALVLTSGAVLYMHSYKNGGTLLALGFFLITFSATCWWRDIIREATYEGHHTRAVQLGLRYGMVLFIISEVFFFVAFFWAFFHSSLAPTIDIGTIWPPQGIEVLSPWQIPLLNTLILLLSGCSVTWSHHAILHGFRKEAILSLVITVSLALIFTSLQGLEYISANFNISDGIYGATFYLATGFHGLHGAQKLIIYFKKNSIMFHLLCNYFNLIGNEKISSTVSC
uniref:Cytochrome c oxidase subunit 3 n=1 Tax=Spongospora subterranea TaxID=70186 RepID=A0A096XTW1_9EUKA|nr:cytochrome c oxidase subunit 3 [Spongospora subterranea]AIK19935.1 cytochrome c oxidase subunit 3 [Spongospora subterranea]